ncbi:hypothetical protein C8034_v002825 [Colletotrichum sidae]|uniref:Uncharacterized protein n=1 Tax=Colletotrichum sidae TaxID=1347389 RepID=A0A4R8TBP0_9PEZI|nr:hypothetical protein C8034_v002825 [Colletotrichum sidae]
MTATQNLSQNSPRYESIFNVQTKIPMCATCVLGEMHAYYDEVVKSELGSGAHIGIIDGFLEDLRSISRRLETRRAQLQALSVHLAQCIQLYELILQQRSNHISNTFSDTAYESTMQVKNIADKTARQTASMHVITVVTLIFLPATFVATFFQSGVLLWNEAGSENMTEPWRFEAGNFRLFSAVCGPLTTIIVGIWLGVYLRLKWKAGRQDRDLKIQLFQLSGKQKQKGP